MLARVRALRHRLRLEFMGPSVQREGAALLYNFPLVADVALSHAEETLADGSMGASEWRECIDRLEALICGNYLGIEPGLAAGVEAWRLPNHGGRHAH
jgi:hypothetical protein